MQQNYLPKIANQIVDGNQPIDDASSTSNVAVDPANRAFEECHGKVFCRVQISNQKSLASSHADHVPQN